MHEHTSRYQWRPCLPSHTLSLPSSLPRSFSVPLHSSCFPSLLCLALSQCPPPVKHPTLPEQMNSGTPPTGTPKSQSGTPRPASVGGGAGGHLLSGSTPTSSANAEEELPQGRPAGVYGGPGTHQPGPGAAATPRPGDPDGPGLLPHAATGVSPSPSPVASLLQREPGPVGVPGGADRLSKEQLEHRERSLQTLRDIERLLLRSGAGPGEPSGPDGNTGDAPGGPNDGANNAANCSSNNGGLPPLGPLRKYEEPLQSIISQTQSLEASGLDEPPMGPHAGLLSLHHQAPSPTGMDVGGLLGPDGLTPEQVAWRKLQEEYYQEKRRQQEMHPHHYRMMPEAGMGGGPMMRGPPPPYHSKPGEQQWPPAAMMGGGMGPGAGGRMMDMHQEGPRAQRFLGQMHRAPPGGGGVYPGGAGAVLPIEAMGHHRPSRPGMGWTEDMPPNVGAGGPFPGCYPPGGLSGPPPHLQANSERFLTREEMFRMLEKRQLQGLHRMELERLGKQQVGLGGPRILDSMGGGGFPGPGMGGGPAPRGDPMDFASSRAMLGSPLGGAGGDAPMGSVNMNPQMQQMILAQKLRAGPGPGPSTLGEMLSSEEMSRIRASQNGRELGSGMQANKGMAPGRGGPLQYPNQGPFPGGPGAGGYLHQEAGPDMFGSEPQGPPLMGASRLSHIPMNSGPRGPELGQRHPSDLSISANPMGSPATPLPHQLKSPSLSQEASPLMPSPSAPSLKSSPPQMSAAGPPPPPLSAAQGTPSSSMKSPQVMGPSSLGLRSPTGSPGRLKSPAMPVASPAWVASPKTTMPSPGGPPSGKGIGNGGSSSTETGKDPVGVRCHRAPNAPRAKSILCETILPFLTPCVFLPRRAFPSSQKHQLYPHQSARLHESQHAVHFFP